MNGELLKNWNILTKVDSYETRHNLQLNATSLGKIAQSINSDE
jgi:hypothetical protein